MGSGKVENNAFVDLHPRHIEKASQGGNAGLGEVSGQAEGNRSEFRPGQANHTDATAAGRGGDGGNQIS